MKEFDALYTTAADEAAEVAAERAIMSNSVWAWLLGTKVHKSALKREPGQKRSRARCRRRVLVWNEVIEDLCGDVIEEGTHSYMTDMYLAEFGHLAPRSEEELIRVHSDL